MKNKRFPSEQHGRITSPDYLHVFEKNDVENAA